MKNKRNILFAISITVATVAGFRLGQVFFDKQQEASSQKIRAIVPETVRKLAFPALQKADGGQLDTASLQGKWNLMFFGYMNCPDICPATLNTVAQAKKEIEKAGGQFPQVVFISVDPGRDSGEALGQYVRYFDKDFIGATGEEKLLTAITIQTNSSFMTQPSDNPLRYQVGHSANLVLINPEVELVAVLRPTHTVDGILNALQYFQE